MILWPVPSLLFPLLVLQVSASAGDRASSYNNCLNDCQSRHCPPNGTFIPSLGLQLTRWSCEDDCKYTCMHQITSQDLAAGQKMQQYHGKWPFWRFFGMQEPASVLFSLMNLVVHLRGWRKISECIHRAHPMKSFYKKWAVISANAWVWSSVFHTRDTPWTERLDYFSAALAIGYALYYTLIRFLHLHPSTRLAHTENNSRALFCLTAVFSIAFVAHASYLSIPPRFDYTYNVAVNLIIGVLHNLLWLAYSLPIPFKRFPTRPAEYRPRFAPEAGIFVLLTTLATGLELFDFEPWARIIDAHSLWHLSTVPIGWYWYEFLIKDADDSGWRGGFSLRD